MGIHVKRDSITACQRATHQWTFMMVSLPTKLGNVKHVKEAIDGTTLKGIAFQEECLKKRIAWNLTPQNAFNVKKDTSLMETNV